MCSLMSRNSKKMARIQQGCALLGFGAGMLFFSILSFLVTPTTYAAEVFTQLWETKYDGGGLDSANAVKPDGLGNLWVSGINTTPTGYSDQSIYYTAKYSASDGSQLCSVVMNGTAVGSHKMVDMVVDAAGAAYVTGSSTNSSGDLDFRTVKYDAGCNQVWVANYDSGGVDKPTAMALDNSGNVLVSGKSDVSGATSFITEKYDAGSGALLWSKAYAGVGSSSSVYPVVVGADSANNVYVSGAVTKVQDQDYLVIKYDSAGVEQWNKKYGTSATEVATAGVVDSNGRVYITGHTGSIGVNNFYTVVIDSNGIVQFARFYDSGLGHDMPTTITLDASGNIYVSGKSGGVFDYDFKTIKYDASGNELWQADFNNGDTDVPQDILVDGSGNVFVAGVAGTFINTNLFALVKYDPSGTMLASTLYGETSIGTYAMDSTRVNDIELDGSTILLAGKIRDDFSVMKFQQGIPDFDLSPVSATSSAGITSGGSLNVSSQIINTGMDRVSSPVVNELYLTPDQTLLYENFEDAIPGSLDTDWTQNNIATATTATNQSSNVLRKEGSFDLTGATRAFSTSTNELEMVLQTYRPLNTLGGKENTYSVTDATGNGYAIELDYSTDTLSLQRLDSWNLADALSMPLSQPLNEDEWYTLKLNRQNIANSKGSALVPSDSFDDADYTDNWGYQSFAGQGNDTPGALHLSTTYTIGSGKMYNVESLNVLEGDFDVQVDAWILAGNVNQSCATCFVGPELRLIGAYGYGIKAGYITPDDGSAAPWTSYRSINFSSSNPATSGNVLRQFGGPLDIMPAKGEHAPSTLRLVREGTTLYVFKEDGKTLWFSTTVENGPLSVELGVWVGPGWKGITTVQVEFDNFISRKEWISPGGPRPVVSAALYKGRVEPELNLPIADVAITDATHSTFSQMNITGGYSYDTDEVRVSSLDWPASPSALTTLDSWTAPTGVATTQVLADNATSGSLSFEAATQGQYVEMSDTFILPGLTEGSFTLEAWVKPATVPPSDCVTDSNQCAYYIMGRSAGSGVNLGLHYGHDQRFNAVIYSDTDVEYALSSGPFVPGHWHHVVQVLDSVNKQLHLYVDGQPAQGSPLIYTGNLRSFPASKRYFIGGVGDANALNWRWHYDGLIDEVAMHNVALSHEAILDRFNGRAPYSDNKIGLAAYLRFDEGTGTIADDRTLNDSDGVLIGGVSWSSERIVGGSSVTVPTLSSGRYRLVMATDTSSAVPETDETDNTYVGQTMYLLPDLVANQVATSRYAALDTEITVSHQISNSLPQAAAGFEVGIYLSTNDVITTDDTRIGNYVMTGLAGGSSDAANTVIHISNALAAGDYYLGLIVDDLGAVAEAQEFNNLLASPQPITLYEASGPAGISITPTSGLTTTERGGTAQFTVVLDNPPMADVVIDLSSDDATEGSVEPASLTFTPSNWFTAQAVTVNGVADASLDGDVPYSIVTAPAVSDDNRYHGVDASNISITNTDQGWSLASWGMRKAITISPDMADADLNNFPVLISLTADTDLAAFAQNNGDDIRFTTADGVTAIPHEIESFDGESGMLTAWVRVPVVSSTSDTVVYLYYGNSSATNQENPAAVWADYQGIWHMNEDPALNTDGECGGGTAELCDSSGNAFHFETNFIASGSHQVPAIVNGGVHFVSPSHYAAAPISNSHPYTISLWFKPETPFTNINIAHVDEYLNAPTVNDREITINAVNKIGFEAATGFSVIQNDSWYHLTVTNDVAEYRIYLNGVLQGTAAGSGAVGYVSPEFILAPTLNSLKGVVDEVRVAPTAVNADWVRTEFRNQRFQQSYISAGMQEVAPDTNSPIWAASAGIVSVDPLSAESVRINLGAGARSDDIAVASVRVYYVASHQCGADNVDRNTAQFQDFVIAPQTTTSVVIEGLTPGQLYCFEATVVDAFGNEELVNSTGEVMSRSLDLNPFAQGWSERKSVIIDKSMVANSDQTDFPVVISMTDASLAANAQADGDDIIFTLVDGITRLSHEIDSYNSLTGELNVWVKVPHLSATADTILFMYYGNSTATNQQAVDETWSDAYLGVWHLNEDPSITSDGHCAGQNRAVCDSSPYASHGRPSFEPPDNMALVWTSDQQVDGKIGKALDFHPHNSRYVIMPGSQTPEFTISMWVASWDQSSNPILSMTEDFYSPLWERHVMINGAGNARGHVRTSEDTALGIDGTSVLPLFDWQHITYTSDGNEQKIYVNGTLESSIPTGHGYMSYETPELVLGHTYIGNFFGRLDEVWFSSAARSADWIKTLHNNQNNPTAYVSVGSVESSKAIVVTPTTGLVTSETGVAAVFNMVLTSQPSADVSIDVSSSDLTEGSVSPATVKFTSDSWSTPQLITVTGVDSIDGVDGNIVYSVITAAAVSGDSSYNGYNPADVMVVNNDSVAGITVMPFAGLVTSELGDEAQFTVVLGTLPSADVAIDLLSSDTTEGTVSPASLTFTSANWNTPQLVVVTGVDDLIADGDVSYSIITQPAVSSDANYGGMDAPDVSLINRNDSEVAGIIVNPKQGLFTGEDGLTADFSIALTTQPSNDVTITLSSSDNTEGTIPVGLITFTPDNWDTPQTITVTGQDDDLLDGAQNYSITTSNASSTDVGYNGLDIPDIDLINYDIGGVGDASKGYWKFDGNLNDSSGNALHGSTPQNPSPVYEASMQEQGIDIKQSGVVDVGDLQMGNVVTIEAWFKLVDNYTHEIENHTLIARDEEGNRGWFFHVDKTKRLSFQRSGSGAASSTIQNIQIDRWHHAAVTWNGTTGAVSFYFDGQPVPVESVGGTMVGSANNPVSRTAVIGATNRWTTSHPAMAWRLLGSVDGLAVYDSVLNSDMVYEHYTYGAPGVTYSKPANGLSTSETGDSDSFSVVLNSQPQLPVTVVLTSSNLMEGTVSPTTMTFTSADWYMPQSATVAGVDDNVLDGNVAYSIVTSLITNDPIYNAIDPEDISAINKGSDGVGDGAVAYWKFDNDLNDASGSNYHGTASVVASPVFTYGKLDQGVDVWKTWAIDVGNLLMPDQVTLETWFRIERDHTTNEGHMFISHDNDADRGWYWNLNKEKSFEFGIGTGLRRSATQSIEYGRWYHTAVTWDGATGDVKFYLNGAQLAAGFTSGNVSYTPAPNPASRTTVIGAWNRWNTAPTSMAYKFLGSIDSMAMYDTVFDTATIDAHYRYGPIGLSFSGDLEDGVVTSEDGKSETINITLSRQPNSDVTLGLSTSNINEASVSPSSLTFTNANWDTVQSIVVTGVDDFDKDGNINYQLVIDPAISTDSNFVGYDEADIAATNGDNEVFAGGAIHHWPFDGDALDHGIKGTVDGTLKGTPPGYVATDNGQGLRMNGSNDYVDLGDLRVGNALTVEAWVKLDVLRNTQLGIIGRDSNAAGNTQRGWWLAYEFNGGGPEEYFKFNASTNGVNTGWMVTNDFDPVVGQWYHVAVTWDGTTGEMKGYINGTEQTRATGGSVIIGDMYDSPGRTANIGVVNYWGPSTSNWKWWWDGEIDGVAVYDVALSADDIRSRYLGAGVTVTPTTGLVTDETGATATFDIVLNAQPSATVTISVASSDVSEGTVSTPLLTFTNADWNVPQTVTVTGQDDMYADGNVAYSIVLGDTVSSDAQFNGIVIPDVLVTNTDDISDLIGLVIAPSTGLSTTEAGGTATFDVRLGSAPAADVTLNLSSSDVSEGNMTPAVLTFTTANWNVAQSVQVTGVDDVLGDGDVVYHIQTAVLVSGDGDYGGYDPQDIAITNIDNDFAGVTIFPDSGLQTSEQGGIATFSVVLDSVPAYDVAIGLQSNDISEGTLSSSQLIFSSSNWNVPQVVTVTGVDDGESDGDIGYTIITSTASGDLGYNAVDPVDVSVMNQDNDTVGISVNPTSGLVTYESGGTAEFTIVLTSRPSADVTIGLASNDSSEGVATPLSVTFTPGNWNIEQTVIVTGVDDLLSDGDVAYSVVTSPAVSSDSSYNNLDVADVTLTNKGDEFLATVSVAASDAFASETDNGLDTGTFIITRAGNLNVPLLVNYSVFGSATAAADYSAVGNSAWFPAGADQVVIIVQAYADAVPEGDETVIVKINTSSDYAIGSPGAATVTIQDHAGALLPEVNIANDQITDEGGAVSVVVTLDKMAASYPVTIPYIVSGDAVYPDDHDAQSNNLVINSGVSASIVVNVVDDVIPEADEPLIITLGEGSGYRLGNRSTHVMTITDTNVAPIVQLSALQGSVTVRQLLRSGGEVNVATVVNDVNSGDAHTYDWSATDNSLVRSSGLAGDSSFVFDPSALSDGFYMVRVSVSDNGVPVESTLAEMILEVVSTLPGLDGSDSDGDGISDASEGVIDSDGDGIEDYLDSNVLASHELQLDASFSDRFIMRTLPELKLSLGTTAFASGNQDALVSESDILNHGDGTGNTAAHPGDSVANLGGYVNFEISGMARQGLSVPVVIPLQTALPANARYRKYQPDTGWQDFVLDNNNGIQSAPGMLGYCPPAGDGVYADGLTEGHYCVQLIIEDGGLNDADDTADGRILDPGGITDGRAVVGNDPVVDNPASVGDGPVAAQPTVTGGGGGGIGQKLLLWLFITWCFSFINRGGLRKGLR